MSYRRLIGVLLLWSLVPMPFLYVVLPPFWIAAAGAAIVAIWRPQRTLRASTWTENLVAVAIVVVVVLTGGLRVGPVRPLGHLLLLLTAWRSFSVQDRQSFLRAAPAVFLLWLAAVASSTHVALAPYLLLSVAVWWWAGMTVLLMGLDPGRRWRMRDLPSISHVLPAALCVAVLAVPVFVAMPRLNSPWVSGSTVRRTSGFSTNVELARSGSITASRELALSLLAVNAESIGPLWTRLRGTAFNMVFAGTWTKGGTNSRAPARRLGLDWLADEVESLDGTTELQIELMRPQEYLFVPEGSVALRAPVPLAVDPVGGVLIAGEHSGPLRYSAWVLSRSLTRYDPPLARDTYLPARDAAVRELAREIAGSARTPRQRAQLVETHLQENFGYSLEVAGVRRSDPIAWFLFEGRQGHCEFFAGAMVVLLRHLDVPARLVGGYNGGALGPDGKTVAVRQANAHTWVEAWLGADEGWVVFDPTPAEGVPELVARTGLDRLRWMWEQLTDSWDRYVLTFGLGEQVGLVAALGDATRWVVVRAASWRHLLGVVVLAFLWAGRRRLWPLMRRLAGRQARRSPTARLVERVVRRLERAGVEIPPRATLRWIAGEAQRRWPAVAEVVGELFGLAEEELYAARVRNQPDRADLRALERRLRDGLGTAGDGKPLKG